MIKRLITRYQDLLAWLPLQIALALAAVVVFGALVRGLGPDLLAWLAELPIHAGYALAALGISYLAWRRWRFQMTDDQKADFWSRLMAHPHGPVVVHVTNAVFYLAVIAMALAFFAPAR